MTFITYDFGHVRDAFVEPMIMPEVLVAALLLGFVRFIRGRRKHRLPA